MLTKRRAIEVAFPIATTSNVGSRERYLHGQTPHSLHVWWARRPFTAMRAVVFSSLAPASTESRGDSFIIAEQLAASVEPPSEIVKKARNVLLKVYDGHAPRVLDIFGGGGTIPLEAARLGCSVATLDINPLACLVQRCILEFSQVHPNLPELVEDYGKRLLHKIKIETQKLYRRDCTRHLFEQRFAFLWGQTVRCANSSCNKTISLSGNWWVSKKKNRKVFLVEYPNHVSGTYVRKLLFNPTKDLTVKRWKSTHGITCPFCGRRYTKQHFQALAQATLREELLCVRVASGKSKTYVLPIPFDSFFPSPDELESEITRELERIGCQLPDTKLPVWSGIVNPPLYGINSHVQWFNRRQLVVLLKVIRGLRETFKALIDSGFSKEVSLAVTAALSGFIDQLVDWNCRLSMWIEENEQVGRALSGPGIPMLWRYAEIDPFANGPANLHTKLDRIVNALRSIPNFFEPVQVHLTSATQLPFDDNTFDAVITDPPYGDNLFYSVLSECIYVWKRMVFKDILPEIFSEPSISRENEIVAPRYKHSFRDAMNFYEEQLTMALREAARCLKKEGVLSFFFAHSTLEAWELVIRVFRKAGFKITGWWPLFLERRARPRGMSARAVNASVVIVARRATGAPEVHEWSWVKEQIEKIISQLANELKSFNWSENDIALACFVKAAGVVAMSQDIVDKGNILPLKECLKLCARYIKSQYPSLSLMTR